MSLLLNLNIFHTSGVFMVTFEHVNARWAPSLFLDRGASNPCFLMNYDETFHEKLKRIGSICATFNTLNL